MAESRARLPFPPATPNVVASRAHTTRPKDVRECWALLGQELELTLGGRVACVLILAIGVVAALGVVGAAFYNVEGRNEPDQMLGFQLIAVAVGFVVCEALLLSMVWLADAAFRGARRALRR